MRKMLILDNDVDILFVIPPFFRNLGKGKAWGLPLGLAYLVSCLKQKAIKSLIYNSDWKDENIEFNGFEMGKEWEYYYKNIELKEEIVKDFLYVLKTLNPKIVGFRSYVVDIQLTITLVRIVKEFYPDTIIIVGGPSASTCAEFLLDIPEIDFLIQGEGEKSVVELANYILRKDASINLKDIAGIVYSEGKSGKKVYNKKCKLVDNLDELPFPDRESMFFLDKNKNFKILNETKDIISSRGCPYLCKFCAAYVSWGTRRPRFRSNLNILKEIEYLMQHYNQRNFIFWDDLFTNDRDRIIEFCDLIMKKELKISWVCLVRINTIDEILLEKMKYAGCNEIQIGIESGNDRVLKYINKGINLNVIYSKVPLIKKSNIDWRIFLIIGFPSETEEEINDTLNIIEKISPSMVDISIFSPYPGTSFYDELQKSGRLKINEMDFDLTNPYKNYTGTIQTDKFISIAFNALKLVDKYNEGYFRRKIENRFKKNLKKVSLSRVLIFQSANCHFTKAILEILIEFNFEIHLLLHKKFYSKFNSFVSKIYLHEFQGEEKFTLEGIGKEVLGIIEEYKISDIFIPCNTEDGRGYDEFREILKLCGNKKGIMVNYNGEFI